MMPFSRPGGSFFSVRLTFVLSGWPKASPLEGRVRPQHSGCTLQDENSNVDFPVRCGSRSLQIILETFRIGDEVVWVVYDAPKCGATRMSAVVFDINDQFVTNSLRVRSVAHYLRLNYELVHRQQEIHARARSSVAWCELFRPNVADPRTQERMQQILDVVFASEGKRLCAPSAMGQRMHRAA